MGTENTSLHLSTLFFSLCSPPFLFRFLAFFSLSFRLVRSISPSFLSNLLPSSFSFSSAISLFLSRLCPLGFNRDDDDDDAGGKRYSIARTNTRTSNATRTERENERQEVARKVRRGWIKITTGEEHEGILDLLAS